MRLSEALLLQARAAPAGAADFALFLASGFTPLHLKTFLHAHLRVHLPERAIQIETAPFGDLAGSLERLAGGAPPCVVALVEWTDLDPRLGLRAAGAWTPAQLPALTASVEDALRRLEAGIAALPPATEVVLALPQLPLPPLFGAGPWEAGAAELGLRAAMAACAARLAAEGRVRVLSPQELDLCSPPQERYDPAGDLNTGFPYTTAHAGVLAALLARHICPPPPKKGLITDLDNTLWRGILGEIGWENVTWELAAHSQVHAAYQVFLDSLAASGILLAVASKNDAALTAQALRRPDLRLDAARLFPVEANWGPKSASVARILQAWNVGPESVVFLDDSPLEVAEVKAAHPEVECRLFEPAPDKLWALLRDLRSWFAKPRAGAEDGIRAESVRQASQFHAEAARSSGEEFLRTLGATIRFTLRPRLADERALELINKTNQFNLNGARIAPQDWGARLALPGAFLLTAAYEDRFGPLGKIAVALGRVEGGRALVDSWVMSCRAFSRRIEHACLQTLFERLDAREVVLSYRETERNRPFRDFLGGFGAEPAAGGVTITRQAFESARPALYQALELAGS